MTDREYMRKAATDTLSLVANPDGEYDVIQMAKWVLELLAPKHEFDHEIELLEKLYPLQYKGSEKLFLYMFGNQGTQIWNSFVLNHRLNIISWFNDLNKPFQMELINKILNEPTLFANA